ncbi:hypothetical protein BDB13_5807 [Rhodococcus sp. OK302]|nr:hypothetical protein BDB13_5807 [Rhodococcus sp. OK302]
MIMLPPGVQSPSETDSVASRCGGAGTSHPVGHTGPVLTERVDRKQPPGNGEAQHDVPVICPLGLPEQWRSNDLEIVKQRVELRDPGATRGPVLESLPNHHRKKGDVPSPQFRPHKRCTSTAVNPHHAQAPDIPTTPPHRTAPREHHTAEALPPRPPTFATRQIARHNLTLNLNLMTQVRANSTRRLRMDIRLDGQSAAARYSAPWTMLRTNPITPPPGTPRASQ